MILLIRHAMVDAHGRFLPGRMPGVHLNEEGRRQAAALGTALRQIPLTAVYSSPLERAPALLGAVSIALLRGSTAPSSAQLAGPPDARRADLLPTNAAR